MRVEERKLLGKATAQLPAHWPPAAPTLRVAVGPPAEEAAVALALAASAVEGEGKGEGEGEGEGKGEGKGEGEGEVARARVRTSEQVQPPAGRQSRLGRR